MGVPEPSVIQISSQDLQSDQTIPQRLPRVTNLHLQFFYKFDTWLLLSQIVACRQFCKKCLNYRTFRNCLDWICMYLDVYHLITSYGLWPTDLDREDHEQRLILHDPEYFSNNMVVSFHIIEL